MVRVYILLVVFLLLACAIALAVGDQTFGWVELASALIAPDDAPASTIVWTLRLPRTVLGALVGAALAVAGTVSQAVLRNPLAEPGILGINAGAALVAVLVIVELHSVPDSAISWLAFLGALVMSGAVYLLAWQQGTRSLRIILVGVGLSALAGGLASFIATFGDVTSVQRAMVWLAGSLQYARWPQVQTLALWLVGPMALVWICARELNLIAMGDDVARGLGQRVNLVRGGMIFATAAISGAAVAAAGLISFVGLAAPHIARRLVGHRHAALIPAAALCGATLVVGADILARGLMPPAQLPVGLVTGFVGAPFFAWLLWKKRDE